MRTGPKALLVVATIVALAFVPDWPHRHLSDPNYWGVAGFVLVAFLMLRHERAALRPGSGSRRLVIFFLVALPVIYVLDWLRFGGSDIELAIQVVGLGTWLTIAWLARFSDTALWLGCAGHAVWDAAHFGRVGFVPDWYVAACVAADLGLGAFVLFRIRSASGEETR